MDLVSGLKSELFRPLVTLLVPGGIAIAPFILVVCRHVPATQAFWIAHPLAFSSAVFVAVLAAGMVLEDLGARIELWWDGCYGKSDQSYIPTWQTYLRLPVHEELIGQRYLRTVITRMKFELSAAPAFVIHAVGIIWLNSIYLCVPQGIVIIVALFLVAVAAYLLWESYQGSGLLHEVRVAIVEAKMREQEQPHSTDKATGT